MKKLWRAAKHLLWDHEWSDPRPLGPEDFGGKPDDILLLKPSVARTAIRFCQYPGCDQTSLRIYEKGVQK